MRCLLRSGVVAWCAACSVTASGGDDAILEGLNLSVSLHKAQIAEGEPMLASLALANYTSDAVEVGWSTSEMLDRRGRFTFIVKNALGDTAWEVHNASGRSTWLRQGPAMESRVRMPPNARFTCERMFVPSGVPLDSAGRPIDTTELLPPGDYLVQAKLLCSVKSGARWVYSDVAAVDIRPAEGKDCDALKLLESWDMRALLSADMTADPAAGDAFLAEHPDTTYAKYVRAETIRAGLERLANKGPAKVDAKQADDLLARAKAFVKENPDFPRSDNILVSVGRALRQLDRDLEARDTFLRVREIYPDSDAASLVQGQIERLPEWARQGVESPPPE